MKRLPLSCALCAETHGSFLLCRFQRWWNNRRQCGNVSCEPPMALTSKALGSRSVEDVAAGLTFGTWNRRPRKRARAGRRFRASSILAQQRLYFRHLQRSGRRRESAGSSWGCCRRGRGKVGLGRGPVLPRRVHSCLGIYSLRGASSASFFTRCNKHWRQRLRLRWRAPPAMQQDNR